MIKIKVHLVAIPATPATSIRPEQKKYRRIEPKLPSISVFRHIKITGYKI
jgi:hypothetical protein